jgi:hypothetical protein
MGWVGWCEDIVALAKFFFFVAIPKARLTLPATDKTVSLSSHENRDIQMMIDAGIEVDYHTPSFDPGEGYFNAEGKRVYMADSSMHAHKKWFGNESTDYQR